MTGHNEIIHQSIRLRIMAALNIMGADETIVFSKLKGLVEATDGNLGAHLDALERAGYVAIQKLFEGKRPQTRVKATPAGKRAFAEHVAYLREIIDTSLPPK